jgi:hypothetical protein
VYNYADRNVKMKGFVVYEAINSGIAVSKAKNAFAADRNTVFRISFGCKRADKYEDES